MILAFQDDGTVRALESVAQANRDYEAIDIENSEYVFLDDRGSVLKPVFRSPSKKKWLFFFSTVDSGPFTFEPTSEKREDLLARLRNGAVPIDSGSAGIRTLEDLRAAAPMLFTT